MYFQQIESELRQCKPLTSTKSDPNFKSNFRINQDSDLNVTRIAPKMSRIRYRTLLASVNSQTVVEIGQWSMINANKSPKIPYSIAAREVEKWSGIPILGQIIAKSEAVLLTGKTNHNTKFQWNQANQLITFAVMLHTDTQTNDGTTDKPTWSRNLRLGGAN